jgi:N-acetylneuraminate synthase/N,N'-diacetyllegionaminate synthase
MKTVEIAGHQIGTGQRCFIIAEAGVNHNGDPAVARQLIEAAAKSGADAVKFQTFKAERIASARAEKADYQKQTTGGEEPQIEPETFSELKEHCRKSGIVFLSSPFDEESADFLDAIDVPAFKIASGEITNLPFLEHIARKGRPILLSTGMSYLNEVQDAVWTIREAGNEAMVLLQCVSNYPADPANTNLRAMITMAETFDLPCGFSDHTMGLTVPLAATALGACVIEKHLTLDRSMQGPDHSASLEPDELETLVQGIRTVESAMGSAIKRPAPSELNTQRAARKSLVANRRILAGAVLTESMIAIKRPGTGIPPAKLSSLVGRRVKEEIEEDTLLTTEMLV